MTGESHSRPMQRMSRFSQAYRSVRSDAELRAEFDRPVDSVLSRADEALGATAGRGSPQWQRYSPPEHHDVIEVEFETVLPVVAAPSAASIVAPPPVNGLSELQPSPASLFEGAADHTVHSQPPPPDIEAIAAALAAEMDRNAALRFRPAAENFQHIPAEPPSFKPAVADPSSSVAPVFAAAEEPKSAETTPPDTSTPTPQPDAAPQDAAPTPNSVDITAADARLARVRATVHRISAEIGPLAKQAERFARTHVRPAAVNAALWLARNLRRKEIRRRYGKALALAHGRVLDRRLEQHFFIPSLSAERFAPAAERAILYEGPVPATSFRWVMSALPQDLREYAFVDFRAGLGRAMLLASQRRFERIVGYEYSGPGYDDLQMNIAQFPRSKMLCRDIQCHRGDRVGVSIPDQPCVLYVANAWREEFLSGIMTYLCDSYRHRPRRLFLILENVDGAFALPKSDIFYRVEPPFAEKHKLRMFSPIDFHIYRTPA